MRRWVETSWFKYRFEEKHSTKESKSRKFTEGRWENNFWEPDSDSVKAGLEKLKIYCDEHQYEIKTIMPLDRAQSHDYGIGDFALYSASAGGWGIGYGWGVNVTTGFMAVLQRVEEVSEEEFNKRMNARKKAAADAASERQRQADITEISTQFEKSKKDFEELKSAYQKFEFNSTCTIATEKGLFGTKYIVSEKSFKTFELAEAYLVECKSKAAALLLEINEMRTKMDAEWKKLSFLREAQVAQQFTVSDKQKLSSI